MDARRNSVYKHTRVGQVVEFEWDPTKAATNLRKHGVRFAEAVTLFEDDAMLTMPGRGTFRGGWSGLWQAAEKKDFRRLLPLSYLSHRERR
jgi:Ribonuclease toxin, BrnT, of type II toxin-antitoxin system